MTAPPRLVGRVSSPRIDRKSGVRPGSEAWRPLSLCGECGACVRRAVGAIAHDRRRALHSLPDPHDAPFPPSTPLAGGRPWLDPSQTHRHDPHMHRNTATGQGRPAIRDPTGRRFGQQQQHQLVSAISIFDRAFAVCGCGWGEVTARMDGHVPGTTTDHTGRHHGRLRLNPPQT